MNRELRRAWDQLFPSGFFQMSLGAQALVIVSGFAFFGPFILYAIWWGSQ
jgi:hypothetical protein